MSQRNTALIPCITIPSPRRRLCTARPRRGRPPRHECRGFSALLVIARLRALHDQTGLTSLLLHYPPSYEHEKTMQSLRLFAERVMPAFRPPSQGIQNGVGHHAEED